MIKNLLFDLGGVIMDIRRQDCEKAFQELGMADITDFLGDYGQKGPFALIEEGKISEAGFRKEVRKHIPGEVTDEAIDAAFNKFLVGIPLRRLEELKKLRKEYKIYLLSNTNSIMWKSGIAEAFHQEGGTVDDYFDGIVTSFETGCCKPSPKIFKRVLKRFDIRADETLFFDDSKANCAAARKLGFKTVHVTPGTEFYDFKIDL